MKDVLSGTPLHGAAHNNSNVEVLKYLISQGTDVNARTGEGKTPLDAADTDEKKHILREARTNRSGVTSDSPQAKNLNTYFMVCWICTVVGLPLCVVLIGFPILITGIVFSFILFYQMWKLIPADIARTTPGKAVGFCFIPFFNLYWIFVAFKGLGEDMNKTLRSQGIQYQVNEGLGLTCCILTLCSTFCNVIPSLEILGILIGIANIVVVIFFFKSVKDGALALLGRGTGGGTMANHSKNENPFKDASLFQDTSRHGAGKVVSTDSLFRGKTMSSETDTGHRGIAEKVPGLNFHTVPPLPHLELLQSIDKEKKLWIAFGVSCLLIVISVLIWRVTEIGLLVAIISWVLASITYKLALKERDRKVEDKLKTRADQGDAEAQYDLACWYQRHKKQSEATQLREQAARNGHALAQLKLGLSYKDGNGVEKNPDQAVYWLGKAAEQGLADAQYELGLCYQSGNGTQKDINQAVSWFRKAADQQHGEAQYELGMCYLRGDGVEESWHGAIDWCKKAVENGSNHAQAIVGFKAIEKIDQLKKRTTVIQELGIDLAKRGYKLSCFDSDIEKNSGAYRAHIKIRDVNGEQKGTMYFGTYGSAHDWARSQGYWFEMQHMKYYPDTIIFNHIIHLEGACILIQAYGAPWKTNEPPEWMVICAVVLASYFTIDYPEWVGKSPGAQTYVNAAFR